MSTPTPEFSRPIRLNEIGDGSRERSIEANADECKALARRFRLIALDRLDARLHVIPEAKSWLVTGTLTADLAQRIKRISGATGEIVFVPRDYTDVELRIPNVEKARTVLGWEPQVELDEGLEKTIAWYRARATASV